MEVVGAEVQRLAGPERRFLRRVVLVALHCRRCAVAVTFRRVTKVGGKQGGRTHLASLGSSDQEALNPWQNRILFALRR